MVGKSTSTGNGKVAKRNSGIPPMPGDDDNVTQQIKDAREESAKTLASRRPSAITAPKFAILSVPLRQKDGSPLVINAFSAKARETMRLAQEMGAAGRKRRPKDPKDFNAVYQGARHISRDGWDGATCATFRNSMISACRLVGFKMTISKLSLFVEPDGVSAVDGTPLVHIIGEPVPFEAPVRNASGVADIRIRPRWDTWSANLRIRFDAEQFSPEDVVNLLVRAGAQCGIGEGRPDSSNSFGQGWGLFEINMAEPIQLHEVEAPKIEFMKSGGLISKS